MLAWIWAHLTGSVAAIVEGHVLAHQRSNDAVRRARYSFGLRLLRNELCTRSFAELLFRYALLDVLITGNEYLWYPKLPKALLEQLPHVTSFGFLKEVNSFLITTQAAVFAVMALAIAIVTFLAQRAESSRGTAEIEVYYYESCTFELASASLALMIVIAVQFFWPAQVLLRHFVPHLPLPVLEIPLTVIHGLWLALNLTLTMHFTERTLRYVNQHDRQLMRRRYTANFTLPEQLRAQLRRHFYGLAADGVTPKGWTLRDPVITLGAPFASDDGHAELTRTFRQPTLLRDVWLKPLRWVLRRWLHRQKNDAAKGQKRGHPLIPMLAFRPDYQVAMNGSVAWCATESGPELDWLEKWLVWISFSFRAESEADRAPLTPDRLLEELVDGAISSIEKNSPKAFERTLDELVEYHGFLLDAYTFRTPTGETASYAAVLGFFRPLQQAWSGLYYPLFAKAADCISEDEQFAIALSAVPFKLLYQPRHTALNPEVAAEILALSRFLVHRLEAWLTDRRRRPEGPAGEAPDHRGVSGLAGSDERAYSTLILKFVGNWRQIAQMTGVLLQWRKQPGMAPHRRWEELRRSWSFIETHLMDSAYLLVAAVWNDDQIAADAYLDTLVKWKSLVYQLRSDSSLPDGSFLSPDLAGVRWRRTRSRTATALQQDVQIVDPNEAASMLLAVEHADVLLLTTAVIVNWRIQGRSRTRLTADTAMKISQRRSTWQHGGGEIHDDQHVLSFRKLLVQCLRILSADLRLDVGDYSARLDKMVSSMDSMTDRDVVAGQVYSPETLNGRSDLRAALLCILLSRVQNPEGRPAPMHLDEELIPDIESTSFNLVHELTQMMAMLEGPGVVEQLRPGFEVLVPPRVVELAASIGHLRRVLHQVREGLEAGRAARLAQARISPARIARLRDVITQHVLRLSEDLIIPATLARPLGLAAPEHVEAMPLVGAVRAQLVDLETGPRSESFDDGIAALVRVELISNVYRRLFRLAREKRVVPMAVIDLAFWGEVVNCAAAFGPGAIAFVAMADYPGIYRELRGPNRQPQGLLRFSYVDPTRDKARKGYRFTINDIDVYTIHQVDAGSVIVVAPNVLAEIRLDPPTRLHQLFDVSLEEPMAGERDRLMVRFSLSTQWGADLLIEVCSAAPEE